MAMYVVGSLCPICEGAGVFIIPSEGREICEPCKECDGLGQVGVEERKKIQLLNFSKN